MSIISQFYLKSLSREYQPSLGWVALKLKVHIHVATNSVSEQPVSTTRLIIYQLAVHNMFL